MCCVFSLCFVYVNICFVNAITFTYTLKGRARHPPVSGRRPPLPSASRAAPRTPLLAQPPGRPPGKSKGRRMHKLRLTHSGKTRRCTRRKDEITDGRKDGRTKVPPYPPPNGVFILCPSKKGLRLTNR